MVAPTAAVVEPQSRRRAAAAAAVHGAAAALAEEDTMDDVMEEVAGPEVVAAPEAPVAPAVPPGFKVSAPTPQGSNLMQGVFGAMGSTSWRRWPAPRWYLPAELPRWLLLCHPGSRCRRPRPR